MPQGTTISNADIALGLRQALDFGIDKQVNKLTQRDGFFKNELVKILLPKELRKVNKALSDIGLSSLAYEGLKVLNLIDLYVFCTNKNCLFFSKFLRMYTKFGHTYY